MSSRPIKEILKDSVALSFPLGGISELTRRINASYVMSNAAFDSDPRVSQNDFRILVGNIRRAFINSDLLEFRNQYPNLVSCVEKFEGVDGHNNHVELLVGDFLLTHHHHTKSDKMPEDFINLQSGYNFANSSLNDYFQDRWFEEKKPRIVVRERLLNLLLLHEKSDESLGQVGKIEFVFPKKRKKFIVLNASELAQKQSEIMDLDSEDLFDFKRRTADEMRRFIA